MTSLALTGIGLLVTCDPDHGRGPLGVVENAAVVTEDARVVYAGPASTAPRNVDVREDVDGRCVMPGFVDCHTHLIFAGDRAEEFARRMAGRPYQPGGILDTVAATRAASRSDLEAGARHLIGQALASGTTTLEIKTGYGLTPEHEAIHLGVARSLTPETTFLGAHLVPPEYGQDRDGYLRLLTETMIPAAATTARWCDVFCESGAFDVEESRAVLTAARAHGMGLTGPRQPAGTQRGGGPGLRARRRLRRPLHPPDQRRHRRSWPGPRRSPPCCPISDFCTRQPYPDGRALLDAGATVAVASNCNPGSSYSTSIPLALALAVRECGLTIDEALLAATRGGAAALQRPDIGCLIPGARADAVVLDAPHPSHLVYRLGAPRSSRRSSRTASGRWVGGGDGVGVGVGVWGSGSGLRRVVTRLTNGHFLPHSDRNMTTRQRIDHSTTRPLNATSGPWTGYSAASARASDRVGWARQLSTMSDTRRWAVTARAMTEMSSAACRPTIDPPSTTPVAGIGEDLDEAGRVVVDEGLGARPHRAPW